MNPIKNIKDLIVVIIGVEIESNLICFVIDRYNNTNTIVIIDLIIGSGTNSLYQIAIL